MGPTKLNKLIDAIALLADLMSRGENLENILKAAIKVLKLAWTTDSIWEVVKALFDLPWYKWLELAAKFILLTALEVGADSISAGFATAAKLTLVVAALYDVFANKFPKIKR